MKPKTFKKSLTLNKQTVASLNRKSMEKAKGGELCSYPCSLHCPSMTLYCNCWTYEFDSCTQYNTIPC